MSQMQLHPLCTLFPRLDGAEFLALRDDIAANGLRDPIITHDGMILDGGNRYRACIDAGIDPKFAKFSGGNLVSFVLSANLHRRHMTAGQQAAIVASAQDWAQAQTVGNPTFKTQSGNVAGLDTIATRAAQSGAGERTQRMADKVARKSPELSRQVAHGEISLPKAHKQVSDAPIPKILPRPTASKTEEKPEVVDHMAPAREHAKKQNAAIKALRAQLADRDATIEALRGELTEARANAAELADSLESYMSAEKGVKEAAAEIKRLLGVLRVVESQRDQYMTTNSELIKTAKGLRAKVERLEKKP